MGPFSRTGRSATGGPLIRWKEVTVVIFMTLLGVVGGAVYILACGGLALAALSTRCRRPTNREQVGRQEQDSAQGDWSLDR
jgi:hypothetical protein